MKKTYRVYQTRNYEKGGDFQSHLIGEYDTPQEAMQVAKEKTSEYLCQITIYEIETFHSGSQRKMVYWQGIRA